MERVGFRVTQASSAEAALSTCRDEMPEIILLDHNLPRLDGLEFLKSLRRMSGGEKPIVFFCTNSTEAELVGSAIWEGAAECLIKPFDADLLMFKLKQTGLVAENVSVAA